MMIILETKIVTWWLTCCQYFPLPFTFCILHVFFSLVINFFCIPPLTRNPHSHIVQLLWFCLVLRCIRIEICRQKATCVTILIHKCVLAPHTSMSTQWWNKRLQTAYCSVLLNMMFPSNTRMVQRLALS